MRDVFQTTFMFIDAAGNLKPAAGVEITVLPVGAAYGGTTPLTTIFQRQTGAAQGNAPEAAVPSGPNPFTTGASGSVEFWAPVGVYDIHIKDTILPARVQQRGYGGANAPITFNADIDPAGGSTGTGPVVRSNAPGIGPLYCDDIRSPAGAQAYQSSGSLGDFNQGYVNLYGTVIAYRAGAAAYDNMRAAAFIVTSDLRLKEQVEEIRGPLQIIESMHGVYHGWTEEDNDRKDFGLIAQEVQETIPELVTETVIEDEDSPLNGLLGIDYARIVPILVEAVKDLSGQVDALTTRLRDIEAA